MGDSELDQNISMALVLIISVYLISRFLIMTKHTSKFPAMLVTAIKHSTVAMVISIESNMIHGNFDPTRLLFSHLQRKKNIRCVNLLIISIIFIAYGI